MKVFCKTYTLFCFWISSGKLSAGCLKKTCAAFELLSTSPWELFEENVLEKFLQICGPFFWSIPVIEQDKFGGPVKTAFFVSINSFWRNNWFGKQMKFFIIFRKWAGSFQLLVKFFDGDDRTAFYMSKKNILTENSFISKFFFIFGHWATFLTNSRKKSSGVVKTGFSVSLETFGWKFFAKLTHCSVFEYRVENFRLVVRKKTCAAFKLLSTSPWEPFEENVLEKFLQICGPFFWSIPVIEQEKFGRSLKTAFSVSTESFWEKTDSEKKWNFLSFLDSEREVFGFLSSFSTGKLELHSTCPK